MADIAQTVRVRNSHSPNHVTLGHFGRSSYDDSAEQWTFLRDTDGEVGHLEEYSSPDSGLTLLRSQNLPSPAPSVPPAETVESTSRIESQPTRLLDKDYAVRFALNGNARGDHQPSTSPPHELPSDTACIVFGYASSSQQAGQHGMAVPIMLCTGPHKHSLKVHFLGAMEKEVTRDLQPTLEDTPYAVPVPSKEPILGLHVSGDGYFLAVRQMSGTSIVIPVYSSDDSASRSVHLEPVVSLPRTATGGYEQTHLAFHPHNRYQIGVVDKHGNWSVWELKGKRSGSSRILYKIKLHTSGKLFPSTLNLKHFGSNLFFDGWHKICYLESHSASRALLVCSRRVARTYHLDGSVRGDVDMRLGKASTKSWVLDVQSSKYCPGICFVLTSMHLQAMRLASDPKASDDLELLCSWPHFRGGSSLGLRLNLVEMPQGKPPRRYRRSPLTEYSDLPRCFWLNR
jgi:hypothetical protein